MNIPVVDGCKKAMQKRKKWKRVTRPPFRWIVILISLVLSTVPGLPFQHLAAQPSPFRLALEEVASGFHQPVLITTAHDGSHRMFVVERSGTVKITAGGETLAAPFLNITDLVLSDAGSSEQGMLGLVFHPRYAENGIFFVTYTSRANEWTLARYSVSEDPNRADADSAVPLIVLPHPGTFHYGGALAFSADGLLYISIGDGSPSQNAQDLGSLYGSLLRIDVDRDQPYAIPPDNPFVDTPRARPEIWARGLRNPWRFSFDRLTNDIYLGDVGSEEWEEVDFQPADSPGGENYGWPLLEGSHCHSHFNPPPCDADTFTSPIYEYFHDSDGCFAVTGGYVYRGNPGSPLYGYYLFADYCRGVIKTLHRNEGGDWATGPEVSTSMRISSFGEDDAGEIYFVDYRGGGVYRIVATGSPIQPRVTGIQPDPLYAGGVACKLNVHGAGFAPESLAYWNGDPRPSSYHDSAKITVELSATDLAQSEDINLLVVNRDSNLTSEVFEIELSSIAGSNRPFFDTWAQTDDFDSDQVVHETWLWGPAGLTCPISEPYLNAPGGTRVVQYFDKSRMEVTNPAQDPDAPWYVTNGLLVVELVTGNLQLGDNEFVQRAPANINVAGDPDDPNGPTYLTFASLLYAPPATPGQTIKQWLTQNGEVNEDENLVAHQIVASRYVAETAHTIAAPFWSFMTSLKLAGGNPFYTTGYPISEAYWTTMKVNGSHREVLIQLFERRVLTYTPTNPPAWQVETGNVGRHYLEWRYGQVVSN